MIHGGWSVELGTAELISRGASSTLMQDIAQGTHNYQNFNEIMPTIYSRFMEKEAREWRQIYKVGGCGGGGCRCCVWSRAGAVLAAWRSERVLFD